ncbi:MAG: CPBP family intramembrane metalloprotease [Rikenellaceae bacterium]|nr:CPBP family intramembrane metalloprotease [Rikenellaceae bacterium]
MKDPLGLSLRGLPAGFLFSIIATLPMFAGYAVTGGINRTISADTIISYAFLAGFLEELFFRGVLFGLLFRYCRWGFIPAVLIDGLIFGALHLYQGHDLMSALASFGITFGAALLYSWIYAEWNFNLWTVVWLHILMNLSWMVFGASSTAAGNLNANIFRTVTILLAIALTVQQKRCMGWRYEVNGKSLVVNPKK